MNRTLTDHIVPGLNDKLAITVCDEPGPGGANHSYNIRYDHEKNLDCCIWFQNGPLQESEPNGVSNESLIAIVIDRMRGFQSGDFACRENAIALTKLQEAMHWLQHRTRERLARGVEGTNQK